MTSIADYLKTQNLINPKVIKKENINCLPIPIKINCDNCNAPTDLLEFYFYFDEKHEIVPYELRYYCKKCLQYLKKEEYLKILFK